MDVDEWESWSADRQARKAQAHKTYENTIDIFIRNSIQLPHEASHEAQQAELNSEQFKLRRAFLRLAREHCEENRLEPGTNAALEIFMEADNCASDIIYAYEGLSFQNKKMVALTPEQVKAKLALTVPSYVSDIIYHVREHGKLGVLQADLSAGIVPYVEGRFKSPDIDRILLQALTQVEIVAFIDEMISKNILTGTNKLEDAAPPSMLNMIWNILQMMLLVWLLSVVIVASPIAITALPQDLMLIIGSAVAGLGTIALMVLGVFGISHIIRTRPHKQKVYSSILDIIDRMDRFYKEFRGSGPFALSHFKKKVDELADTGVIWPSGLYVLIEDMEIRGVRSF